MKMLTTVLLALILGAACYADEGDKTTTTTQTGDNVTVICGDACGDAADCGKCCPPKCCEPCCPPQCCTTTTTTCCESHHCSSHGEHPTLRRCIIKKLILFHHRRAHRLACRH